MKRGLYILFFSLLLLNVSKAQDFLNKWDFDRDGKNDSIKFDYSGGAHCCYSINIKLSSRNTWEHFDYEMDGGYVMGVDGSQPNHFNIKDYDNDSVPEIFMETGTYGGGYGPWSEQILIDCENGHLYDKSFDIYEYERSQKNITCSGKNGFAGYYVARDEDSVNELNIDKNKKVDFSSRTRGVGGWEYNYTGNWEMKGSTMTITYLYQYYSDMPDNLEKLKEPIIDKFVFSEKDCIFKQQFSNIALFYFKEN